MSDTNIWSPMSTRTERTREGGQCACSNLNNFTQIGCKKKIDRVIGRKETRSKIEIHLYNLILYLGCEPTR